MPFFVLCLCSVIFAKKICMKWIGKRTSVVDQKDSLSFVIYPEPIGWKKHLIGFWFVLWLAIGAYVTSEMFRGYEENQQIVLFIFMAFWMYFAIRVGKTALYQYFGKELIKINDHELILKKATGPYGKSNRLFLENITKMREVELKDNSFQNIFENSPWVAGTPRIEFEHLGKTYSFGRKLNPSDRRLIYNYITKRITKNIRQAKKV